MAGWWREWGGPLITRDLVLYGGKVGKDKKLAEESSVGGCFRRETHLMGMASEVSKEAVACSRASKVIFYPFGKFRKRGEGVQGRLWGGENEGGMGRSSAGRGGIRPWELKVFVLRCDALIVMYCLSTSNVMMFWFKLNFEG